jgi:hypothetical protein
VLALAARVYPRCTQERLTLFNKLTYQKIKNKQNRYKWKRIDKLRTLYVTRVQYNVTCKLCSGGEGRGAVVYHYGRTSQGPKR